ncbi:MAG TPA: transcription termination/antitermination protein NusG [Alphaproteobacteria bacterium]|nr:transcription termination/antitermination protein NusG [Alphaproteobacteria bacterium]
MTQAKWYIVNAASGSEKKAAEAIKERAVKKGIDGLFEEISVPTESYLEVKRGKKVQSERRFLPGYVLVKMVMNDETWQLVKNTPKITGFLGGGGAKPQPISEREAMNILKQVEDGKKAPKSKVSFHVGDSVKIIDGAFESFVGSVEEVDEDGGKLKVAVSIFGRATPVELAFSQVEKG